MFTTIRKERLFCNQMLNCYQDACVSTLILFLIMMMFHCYMKYIFEFSPGHDHEKVFILSKWYGNFKKNANNTLQIF